MTFRRLGLCCVAVAMFAIAGGPCAALQTVAWAEMLRDYALQSGSLAVAVEQTFDGQHPCELCRRVAAVKSQEQKQTPAKSSQQVETKAKALPVGTVLKLERPDAGTPAVSAVWTIRIASRAEPPPTPPPRLCLRPA